MGSDGGAHLRDDCRVLGRADLLDAVRGGGGAGGVGVGVGVAGQQLAEPPRDEREGREGRGAPASAGQQLLPAEQ